LSSHNSTASFSTSTSTSNWSSIIFVAPSRAGHGDPRLVSGSLFYL
jgi:hypothetical protein